MTQSHPTVSALRASHERLAAAVKGLDAEGVRAQSYDHEWSIAQVLSHLGSGAEIFLGMASAVVEDRAMPGQEAFPPIWERWNTMEPAEQVAGAVETDGRLVELFEGLDDQQLALPVNLFGMELDLAGLGRMRLSEHTFHTWDVVVAGDPAASLGDPSVPILVDAAGLMIGRTGKPGSPPRHVRITTTGVARSFDLVTGDPVTLTPVPSATGEEPTVEGSGQPEAELVLPAEAWLRLLAGRLDPDHTPAEVAATGIELDELRKSFPGY